ncbi:hypothetical protein GGR50DRAFT_147119 [Xylaria sp. CBS 124048]|nr:hypothetical protein GGR50DRAFT_147119 [Xylaria sp. CBS 124048]
MRPLRPVCLLCRLRVVEVTSKVHAIKWNTQTPTAPLSTTVSRNDGSRYRSTMEASEDTAEPVSVFGERPSYLRKILLHDRPQPTPVARASIEGTEERYPSRLEALFQEIIEEQKASKDGAGAGAGAFAAEVTAADPDPDNEFTRHNASVNLPLVSAIEKLADMVDQDAPIADAYHHFLTLVKPALGAPDVYVPPSYKTTVLAMLDRLVLAKKADMLTESLPRVADIFLIYSELSELNPKKWAVLVGELARCIVNAPSSTRASSTASASRDAMFADLLESWKVLSRPRLSGPTALEKELANSFWFPNLSNSVVQKLSKIGSFPSAFNTLFPQYQDTQLGMPISTLGIITYVLMHDESRCPVAVKERAQRLLSRLSYLIKFVDYQDKRLRTDLVYTAPALETYVMHRWPSIKAQLMESSVTEDSLSTDADTPIPNDDSSGGVFDARHIRFRLGRVAGTVNHAELDRLWTAFIGTEVPMSKKRIEQIRQNSELIDAFIKTRMMFRQSEMAVAAWGLMSKVGLKPSLRTWNLMLDGLRETGNLAGLKNVWTKLIRTGLKLDASIWTTRIGGLIDCGDVEGGLHALQEMAHTWERTPTAPTAVMLSVEPVNAALVALIRLQRQDAADKVLAWADKRGIKPDIYTFNTMLHTMIRAGNQNKSVERLFALMHAQGVQPDVATFTLVLDASYLRDEVRSAEEQTKIVTDVVASMRVAGLEPNLHTYGKMIYLLLRSNAIAAAVGIFNYLHERNMKVSPHIYTMLIQHCFEQTPPDLESIRLFISRRRYRDFDDMDRVFYERVVNGYAQVGETEGAVHIFNHVMNAGSSLSLPTLTLLLNALLEKGEIKKARAMVNREKKRFEKLNPDPTRHFQYWGHRFWQLARENRLLRLEPDIE